MKYRFSIEKNIFSGLRDYPCVFIFVRLKVVGSGIITGRSVAICSYSRMQRNSESNLAGFSTCGFDEAPSGSYW